MKPSALSLQLSPIVTVLAVYAFFLTSEAALAGSATWSATPPFNDWNFAGNWTPNTIPAFPSDTATFQTSGQTSVSLSGSVNIDGIVFSAGANQFSIGSGAGVTLAMSGAGITNNSGTTQNFALSGPLVFSNSATAGSLVNINNAHIVTFGGSASAGSASITTSNQGSVTFNNSSTAGNATFASKSQWTTLNFNNSADAGSANVALGPGGITTFRDNSSAANAQITVDYSFGTDSLSFTDASTAGNSTITVENPGRMSFSANSTAGTATLVGNSGGFTFSGSSTAELARLVLNGNSTLDIGGHAAPGMALGSIEGTGYIFLANRTLTVGTNNADTTFAGQIQGNSFSALVKAGTGTLTLANANTYIGPTRIDGGTLRASHDGAFGAPATSSYVGGYISVGSSAALTLDNGATNDYIAKAANLILAAGSTVNLNFSGNPDRVRSLIFDGVTQPPGVYGGPLSGAPNQLPQFTGTGRITAVVKAVSRRIHGAAGAFDVDLPLAGPPGIECRSGGPGGEYQLVVTFSGPVAFSDTFVVFGSGNVTNYNGSGTATATINLSGVGNAQMLYIEMFDVNDGTGPINLIIPMGILVGDENANGIVNSSDVALVKPLARPVTTSTFRADVNVNGAINSSDLALVKSQSGTSLP